MKQKLLITAVLVFFSSVTLAGLYQPAPVTVDLEQGAASGDMTTAANSNNKVEFIGCGSRSFEGGFHFGFCQASDAAGNQATCFTEDPTLLDEIQGLSDRAFIQFNWTDDGAGNLTCVRVGSSTQSFYLDKVKP